MANVGTYGLFAVVDNYIAQTRILLQDTVDSPYRYSDTDLIVALNMGLTQMKKLRPDLFLSLTAIPNYDGQNNTTDVVPIDEMYRFPLVLFMVGWAQLRDDEEVQDQRAAAFLSMFAAKLGTMA